jgi:hypothetical protein
MTTQQDILRTMMTQLDEASDKIPEGLYLQFCDHLKNLHTCQPTSVALQRSSGPRRCGRCHHVGHDRRSCPTMRVTGAHLIQHTRMGKHQPKLVSREKLFFVQTTRTGVALMGVESTLRLIYQKPSSLGRADATPAHTRILVLDLKFVWRGSIRRILGCRRR